MKLIFIPVLFLGACVSAFAEVTDPNLIGEPDCRIVNPMPVANERVLWSGGCKNGFADGPGRLEWFVGDVAGSVYEGTMLRGRPHGLGDYVFATKARYHGEFQNGEWHGRGVSTSPSGDKMNAQFVHGKPSSEADVDIEYSNGNHYVGRFKDGMREGKGTMVRKDGSRYVGDFKHGMWDGHGVATYANGAEYEGDWAHGEWEGKGYLKYANKDKYEGQFKAGKRDGTGLFVSATGTRYQGEWKADRYDGQGTITYELGESYTGSWKAGKYDGEGEITYPGGRKVAGEFKDGRPVGPDSRTGLLKTMSMVRDADQRTGKQR